MPLNVSQATMNLQLRIHWFIEEDAPKEFRAFEGYRTIVHSPYEFPSESSCSFYFLDQFTQAAVTPEVTLLSDDLKTRSYQKRNCFFNGEKPLKYFKVYNRQNCNQECLSLNMSATCGCVLFYLISEV
jgi:acid-sensing ion channel, other